MKKQKVTEQELREINQAPETIMPQSAIFNGNGDLSNWDVSKVKKLNEFFGDRSNLSSWDVSKVKKLNEFFGDRSNLSSWDVPKFKEWKPSSVVIKNQEPETKNGHKLV
jgi:Mycoplasma protein of unknown function, DUF285